MNFRENKNRYVFSFLSALIDMDILSTVELDFMLVGHTGNQVGVTLNTGKRLIVFILELRKCRGVNTLKDL